ncbi:hypothetical protein DFQ27_001703, partial [Actinomortierella ambigua]
LHPVGMGIPADDFQFAIHGIASRGRLPKATIFPRMADPYTSLRDYIRDCVEDANFARSVYLMARLRVVNDFRIKKDAYDEHTLSTTIEADCADFVLQVNHLDQLVQRQERIMNDLDPVMRAVEALITAPVTVGNRLHVVNNDEYEFES